jgi:hypothetical protein
LYPYKAISIQAGDLNTLFDTYTNATHYYIGTAGWSSAAFSVYADISDVYRFDIDECVGNDFNATQVSWINSFGFRDYFSFTKRSDNVANITRNTFRKLDANWGGTTISVDNSARGEQVYDQSLSEEFTITTKYLTDAEANYLKNLYFIGVFKSSEIHRRKSEIALKERPCPDCGGPLELDCSLEEYLLFLNG